MKKLLSIFALSLIIPSVVSANVFEELKTQPLTKYDAGKIQLAMLANVTNQSGDFEAIGKFKTAKLEFIEEGGALGYKVVLTGRSKYLTDEQCQTAKVHYRNKLTNPNALSVFFGNTDKVTAQKLSNELLVITELRDKDNSTLTVTCK